MRSVNVREAREHIGKLLDAVATGEDIVITRYGRPVARLSPIDSSDGRFPDRSGFRASLSSASTSAAQLVRTMRDDERF